MADEHESMLNSNTEQLLFLALFAALGRNYEMVRRHAQAVVEQDPVAGAAIPNAVGRLMAQLLDGLLAIGVDTNVRLQPALDFAELAAVTCDLTERALPAVIDLLTAAVRRSGDEDPVMDRLCREPELAGEVLSVMIVASAQRLAVGMAGDRKDRRARDDHGLTNGEHSAPHDRRQAGPGDGTVDTECDRLLDDHG